LDKISLYGHPKNFLIMKFSEKIARLAAPQQAPAGGGAPPSPRVGGDSDLARAGQPPENTAASRGDEGMYNFPGSSRSSGFVPSARGGNRSSFVSSNRPFVGSVLGGSDLAQKPTDPIDSRNKEALEAFEKTPARRTLAMDSALDDSGGLMKAVSGSGSKWESDTSVVSELSKPSASKDPKLFKLLMIPSSDEEYDLICRAKIGNSGKDVCVNKNCQIASHKKCQRSDLAPGDIAILKLATEKKQVVFEKPTVSGQHLSPDLLKELLAAEFEITDLSESFHVIKSVVEDFDEDDEFNEGSLVTPELFQQKSADLMKLANFKTPAKKKINQSRQTLSSEEDSLGVSEPAVSPFEIVSPYKPRGLGSNLQAFDEVDDSQKLVLLSETLKDLDSSVAEISVKFNDLVKHVSLRDAETEMAIRSLLVKLENLMTAIGVKPAGFAAPFQAPDLWASLADMAAELQKLLAMGSSGSATANEEVKRTVADLQSNIDILVSAMEDQTRRTSELETNLDTTVDIVEARFDREHREIVSWGQQLDSKINEVQAQATGQISDDEVTSIKAHLAAIDADLRKAPPPSGLDNSFGGELLKGITGPADVQAWLELNSGGKPLLGLFSDPLMATMNMDMESTGRPESYLTDLVETGKLSGLIENQRQGATLKSFTIQAPPQFTATFDPVIDKNASNFSKVKSFAQYSNSQAGTKTLFEHSLNQFEMVLGGHIDRELASSSTAAALCRLALSETVEILRAILHFIEIMHRALIEDGFAAGPSWHLVTRLVLRFFREMAVPRSGISMNATPKDGTAAFYSEVLWAQIQCLRIGRRMRSHTGGFRKDPSVSSELVEFLLEQSNQKAVAEVTAKVLALERENTTLRTETREAIASAKSIGNTMDSKIKDAVKQAVGQIHKEMQNYQKKP
jgi:hypothetical protein